MPAGESVPRQHTSHTIFISALKYTSFYETYTAKFKCNKKTTQNTRNWKTLHWPVETDGKNEMLQGIISTSVCVQKLPKK